MWCGDFVCGVRVDIRTATFGPVHSKRGELRIPTMSALESCQQALARLGCDLSFDELALRPGVERSSIVTYLLERFDACAVQSCFVFWTSSYTVMLTHQPHLQAHPASAAHAPTGQVGGCHAPIVTQHLRGGAASTK